MFQEIYYSKWFQDWLVLKVVDEAHMIYAWGLVSSRKSGRVYSYTHIQDVGVFRPSYGNLGGQLMATNQVPLLLMSATCPPLHLQSILSNLRITSKDIEVLRGELTRPEITMIRVTMKKSMRSVEDLLQDFQKRSIIADDLICPTLIYSGKRNTTMKVLKVINRARGTSGNEFNANSTFGRIFHSCTGEKDKFERIRAYAEGKFPVMSCTLALGLGQNWVRVRRVIQIGWTGLPSLTQITGRCGRNGQPGLAVIYVEKTRRHGKNKPSDFSELKLFSDDDLMDAFAVTPVCLQIALSLSNLWESIVDHSFDMYKEKTIDFETFV